MARRAGSTTRLKVTMLLTGLPGSPNTTSCPLLDRLAAASIVANVSGLPGFMRTFMQAWGVIMHSSLCFMSIGRWTTLK